MRELFCRYGIVDILVSDNGRQFTSQYFTNFLKLNNVKHILTAPGHPATNGQAENFIKILKKSILANLKNETQSNFDMILNRFLCDYRNTKHCTTGESPAKLFFGRFLKTRFSSLKPPLVKQNIIESQTKAVKNHKGNRNITFAEGQKVFIRDYTNPNKASWSPATIKQILGSRSYSCILQHNNKVIKRHVDQMRSQHSDDNVKQYETNANIKHSNNNESFESCTEEFNTEDELVVPESLGNAISTQTHAPTEDLSRVCFDKPTASMATRKLRPRIAGKVVDAKFPNNNNS